VKREDVSLLLKYNISVFIIIEKQKLVFHNIQEIKMLNIYNFF